MNGSWFCFSVHPAFRKASPDAEPLHESLREELFSIDPADTKRSNAARARYIANATRHRISLVGKPASVQAQGPSLPILVHHIQEHAASQGLRPSELLPKIAKHLDVPDDQVLRNLDGIAGLPDQLTNLKGNRTHQDKKNALIFGLTDHMVLDEDGNFATSDEDFDKEFSRVTYRQRHGVDSYPIDEVPDIATHLLHGPSTLNAEGKSAHARAIGYALASEAHTPKAEGVSDSDISFDKDHDFFKLISHNTGLNEEEIPHLLHVNTAFGLIPKSSADKGLQLIRQRVGERSAYDWAEFYMSVADKIREACYDNCSSERNRRMRDKTKYEQNWEQNMANATGAYTRDLNSYRREASPQQHAELQRLRNMLFLPKISKLNPDTGKKWTSADLSEQIGGMKHLLSSDPSEETVQSALSIANLQNAHPDTWGK